MDLHFDPETKHWIVLGIESCKDAQDHYYVMSRSSQTFRTVSDCHDDLAKFLKTTKLFPARGYTSSVLVGPVSDGLLDFRLGPQDAPTPNCDFDLMCDLFPWVRWTAFRKSPCDDDTHMVHFESSVVPFESSYQCALDFNEKFSKLVECYPDSWCVHKCVV